MQESPVQEYLDLQRAWGERARGIAEAQRLAREWLRAR